MIEFETKGYRMHFMQGEQEVGKDKYQKIRGILNPRAWFQGVSCFYKWGFSLNEGGWPANISFALAHPDAKERNAVFKHFYLFFFGLRICYTWGHNK